MPLSAPPRLRHTLLQWLLFAAALLLPALLFWPRTQWLAPDAVNQTSYGIVLVGIAGALVTLRALAQFPGQRSKSTVIPVALAWFGLCLAVSHSRRLSPSGALADQCRTFCATLDSDSLRALTASENLRCTSV